MILDSSKWNDAQTAQKKLSSVLANQLFIVNFDDALNPQFCNACVRKCKASRLDMKLRNVEKREKRKAVLNTKTRKQTDLEVTHWVRALIRTRSGGDSRDSQSNDSRG